MLTSAQPVVKTTAVHQAVFKSTTSKQKESTMEKSDTVLGFSRGVVIAFAGEVMLYK